MGNKNLGSTNKYTKIGRLIIRKIIKIIATRCHILRLKCTNFYSRRLSVRPSLIRSLTLTMMQQDFDIETRRTLGHKRTAVAAVPSSLLYYCSTISLNHSGCNLLLEWAEDKTYE